MSAREEKPYLTPQQLDVLARHAQGQNLHEIAGDKYYTYDGIRRQARGIRRRLGVPKGGTTADAVRLAQEMDLLP